MQNKGTTNHSSKGHFHSETRVPDNILHRCIPFNLECENLALLNKKDGLYLSNTLNSNQFHHPLFAFFFFENH